ncbi:MAG TPA: tubulin-like doman-containing protein [Arachnia sp.]|nr:tubulin-like doman-containing protein [Arachnia sp.]HMT84841.1 tubulin-like doman-containing protein [Arachnia sp.]
MSLRPQLFIGVGGTGGKTVGMIHYQLSEALKRVGIMKMPAGWQFLHIDVAAEVDVRTQDLFYELPRDAYVPLTNNQSTYIGLDQTIGKSLAVQGQGRHVVWDAWRPNPPENVPVSIHLGAGQFRALGRVAALAGLETIYNRITMALAKLNETSVAGELAEVQRALGTTVTPGNAACTVFVVGSLAGGSGSGMFLEVCDVVRACGETPIGIAFAPDVFMRSDGTMDPGVAPNTFLAASELSHAMWRVDAHAPYLGRTEMFARARVPRPPSARTAGPETLFLVGRSNGQTILGDANEVYRVMARNLAEIALDEDLANALHAYSLANAGARAAGSTDLLGLSYGNRTSGEGGGKDYGTFTGLGFGRLTLGRDFFGRYAARRMQRTVVERLLDHHLTLHYAGDGKTDDQVLADAATRAWAGFIQTAQLDEQGESANDIQDALDPLPAVRAQLEQIRGNVFNSVSAPARGRTVDVATARSRASQIVASHLDKTDDHGLHRQAERALQSTVEAWSARASDSLRAATINAIAEWGFPVALRVLERLDKELATAAGQLSGTELKKAREKAQTRLNLLALPEQREKNDVKVGDPLLSTIADRAKMTLESHVDVWKLEWAAPAIEDLRRSLVRPWRTAVADADASLRSHARPSTGAKPIDQLPREQGIPEHLRPSKMEQLLDDLHQFPEAYVDYVARSVGEGFDLAVADGQSNAISAVISQVISGDRLPNAVASRLRPAAYNQIWVPQGGTLRHAPASAEVSLAMDWEDIEERIHYWLHDDTKEIGRHLTENLFGYLEGGPGAKLSNVEYTARVNRLVDQFKATLSSCRPLVELDPVFVQDIHNRNVGDVPLTLLVSPIGIPPGHDKLQQALSDQAAAAFGPGVSLTFSETPTDQITMFAAHSIGFHALEMASIMRPVATQYAAHAASTEFWKYRRARPLSEWVPLGPQAAQDLITGWFVARFLGRAKVSRELPLTHEVWVPANNGTKDGSWVSLPRTGVRPVVRHNQVGILLELVAIAMIEASHTRSMAPLAPFQELIRLGGDAAQTFNTDAFRTWVRDGSGVIDAANSYCPTPLATVQDRIAAVDDRADRLLRQYEAHLTPEKLANLTDARTTMAPETEGFVREALDVLRRRASLADDSEQPVY